MTTNKPVLWVAIVAALSMPVTVQAQHAGHETHATPRSVAPLSSAEQHAHGQHDDHTEAGDTHHGDRPEMDHADHSQMDHSRMDHAGHSSGDPNHGLREPIPPITDADREAAFPELQHQHKHGASRHSFWLLDQLEVSDTSDGTEIGWEGIGWVGSDINRLWLRSKGHALDGSVERGRIEALYGRPVLPWWDVVAGVRQDFGNGPSRTWVAFGVQGLAPYFFEMRPPRTQGKAAERR